MASCKPPLELHEKTEICGMSSGDASINELAWAATKFQDLQVDLKQIMIDKDTRRARGAGATSAALSMQLDYTTTVKSTYLKEMALCFVFEDPDHADEARTATLEKAVNECNRLALAEKLVLHGKSDFGVTHLLNLFNRKRLGQLERVGRQVIGEHVGVSAKKALEEMGPVEATAARASATSARSSVLAFERGAGRRARALADPGAHARELVAAHDALSDRADRSAADNLRLSRMRAECAAYRSRAAPSADLAGVYRGAALAASEIAFALMVFSVDSADALKGSAFQTMGFIRVPNRLAWQQAYVQPLGKDLTPQLGELLASKRRSNQPLSFTEDEWLATGVPNLIDVDDFVRLEGEGATTFWGPQQRRVHVVTYNGGARESAIIAQSKKKFTQQLNVQLPKSPKKPSPSSPAPPKSPKSPPKSPKSRPQSPKSRPQSPKSRPKSPKSRPRSPKSRPRSPKSRKAPMSPTSPRKARSS